MFGRRKKLEGTRYVIAVKNFHSIEDEITAREILLPYKNEVYFEIFRSAELQASELKELRKFIRANGKQRKEVQRSWENLIGQGYTLLNVRYDEKSPSIEQVCSSESIKYVTTA